MASRGSEQAGAGVEPTPSRGLLAWVIYVVVFIGLFAILGVDYDAVSHSTGNVLRAIVIPVGAAAAAMALLTTRWGWWRPVMHDRAAGPDWARLIPVLIAVGIVFGLASTSWSEWDAGHLLLLLVGCALVGFGEEISNRGLVVVAMRGGFPEARVWLISSVLFALLHAANIVVGQDVGPTIQQMVFAFLVGSAFYVTRRVTGLLAVPMILHGLWDFTTFTVSGPDGGSEVSDAVAGQTFLVLAAVILTFVVLRRVLSQDPAPARPQS